MKKMMKLLTVVAVAAMGLTACQNSFEEVVNGGEISKPTITVNFVADEARTAVDTSGDTPLFSWNDSESFAVLEQTDALAKASSVTFQKVDGKASIDAEFALNAGKDEYKYVAVHPASGYVEATSLDAAVLALPFEQSMVAGSYDPNADLMVSEVVTTAAQPTEAQQLRFTRLAAIVKMSVKNLTIGAGETIEKVEFTANGQALAGTISANLEDPHAYTAKQSSSSVSVATSSADEVYFTVLPTTLEAGNTYNVVVATDKKIYIKEGEIPAGKSLKFESGMVSRFSVNMTDAVVADRWELVRDASTLAEGDVVAIVSNQYNYILSANKATNYPYASKTEVVKCGSFFRYTPADATKENMIQLLTIAKRDSSRNAFDFYNAANDYEGDTDSGFLCAPGSGSQYLKQLSYYSAETQFDVTIDNGIAAIIATNATGTSKQMIYKHNASSATSRYFCCYSSTDAAKAVCIYRLVGAKRTIPVVDANVAVPSKSVIISEDATQTATEIKDVVFNYVGDWTLAISDNADWLNVVYNANAEKNYLTYTAEANTDTSAARSATVTITASRGEETLEPWTFTIEQKKAPTVISIADFAKLSKDLTAVYKLTGKVTTLATSSSAAYVLSDELGNVANIKYLYTESDDAVWGHDDIEVKLGDVITVTTVPQGSKNGGSSSYHSIFKGYYRLTATASPTLIGCEGGSATITLATEGNMLPNDGVINGAPAEAYDFVTFNYTSNAATATATFATNSGGSRNAVFNFTYGLTSVAVKIGQKNDPSVKTGWFLVTNLSELAVGDKVIIASKSVDETIDYAIKTYTSSNPSTNPAIQIELLGDSISNVEGVEQFTLESGLADYAGTWAFKCDSQSRYLNVTSGSLKLTLSLEQDGSWTIDIAADGKATLVSQTTNANNTIMFNDVAKTFTSNKSTTTGKGAIYLFKEYK